VHAVLIPDEQSKLSLGMPVLAELIKDFLVNIGAEGLEQRDQIRRGSLMIRVLPFPSQRTSHEHYISNLIKLLRNN